MYFDHFILYRYIQSDRMLFLLFFAGALSARRSRRKPSSTNDILKITFDGPLRDAFDPIYVRPVKHRSHKDTKEMLLDLLKVLTEDKYQEENVHSPGEREFELALANIRQMLMPIGMLSNKGRMNRLKKRVIRAQSVKPYKTQAQTKSSK